MKEKTLPPIHDTTIEREGTEYNWEIVWRNQKMKFPYGIDHQSSISKDIVRELWTMVEKCMQYNPSDRYETTFLIEDCRLSF